MTWIIVTILTGIFCGLFLSTTGVLIATIVGTIAIYIILKQSTFGISMGTWDGFFDALYFAIYIQFIGSFVIAMLFAAFLIQSTIFDIAPVASIFRNFFGSLFR